MYIAIYVQSPFDASNRRVQCIYLSLYGARIINNIMTCNVISFSCYNFNLFISEYNSVSIFLFLI